MIVTRQPARKQEIGKMECKGFFGVRDEDASGDPLVRVPQ